MVRAAVAIAVVTVLGVLAGCGGSPPTWLAGSAAPSATVPVAPVTPSPTPPPSPRPKPVPVAIFGDSQATALFTTRPSSVNSSLQLTDRSISACGIMRGTVVSRDGERFDLIGACPNWLSKWRDDAKRTKAAIDLVVVGAWDVFDVQTPTGMLYFGTAQWDTAFLDQLRSGVAALRESGAQVALAELPCYRPRETNPRPPGYWPERGDDNRIQHINDLLRQLADHVHVFTVTPPSSFCTDPTVGDNKSNRYDGVHYLQPGASLYFEALIPQLVTLPSA
jgi:hypothetical protein